MSGQLILVTGVGGFVAGQVAEQALKAGYRVRGTARGTKLAQLQARQSSLDAIPNFEVVEVKDLAKDDISHALVGVDAVVHTASPLPTLASLEDTMSTAIEGPLHIVRQAEKAGIKKIVVTSSFGNVMDPTLLPSFTNVTISDSDWGVAVKEEIPKHADDPYYIYYASKTLGEKALWDFARAHPHLDVATILPGTIFGPWASFVPQPTAGIPKELGTNTFPFMLISGMCPPEVPPFIVDVRDVAKAHVRALGLPALADPARFEEKRFLINGGNLWWTHVSDHLREKYKGVEGVVVGPPELFVGGELVKKAREAGGDGLGAKLDTTRALEVLGIKADGGFIDPIKTFDDSVDAILELKKAWAAAA